MSRLCIVTASTQPLKTLPFWSTWFDGKILNETMIVMVLNGRGAYEEGKKVAEMTGSGSYPVLLLSKDYGVVPNFQKGIREARDNLLSENDVILCLHDDVAINQLGWDEQILEWISQDRKNDLFGFGGATSLGRLGMYDEPYDPTSLARGGFVSNMRDAEAHGSREIRVRRVAVLDGFSIGGPAHLMDSLFSLMKHRLGIVHHAYDAAVGCYAARWNIPVWLFPIACHHHGGMTAVADKNYNEWALSVREEGDQSFWKEAHRVCYNEFQDVLPFSTTW